MFCAFHKKRFATNSCAQCGRGICADCRVIVKGKYFCYPCSNLPIPGVKFTPWRKPDLAAFLSFLFPGAGQVYNGQIGKGFLILLTSWMVVPWIYGIRDAYKTAQKINWRKLATKPVLEAWVGFIIMVIVIYAILFNFYQNYPRVDHNAILAKETLEVISQAAESYAKDHGQYPATFSELYFATPSYLEELYCDMETAGYSYTCVFSKDGYAVTAKSEIASGKRKIMTVRTGGVFDVFKEDIKK